MIQNYRDQSDQVSSIMKTRQDNDVTNCIGEFHAKNDTKLSWLIRSSVLCDENRVPTLTKMRLDNYMTNHTDAIYAKNKTKLLWIRPRTIYYENQLGQ